PRVESCDQAQLRPRGRDRSDVAAGTAGPAARDPHQAGFPVPVLFRQTRLGRGGQVIRVLKFRSMAVDADLRLREILARDPLARQEFEATHKLKHDPRVTRVGNWLRRYSLDELPQLWNVWRGHMSLVGPRPIVAAEIPKYAESYPIVSSVRPGLTGVWQTSGRSDVSYESRRRFDVG